MCQLGNGSESGGSVSLSLTTGPNLPPISHLLCSELTCSGQQSVEEFEMAWLWNEVWQWNTVDGFHTVG